MTKVERHMDICKGLNKIYEQKNHDYGDSFHDTFVEEGMAMARIRLSDKLNRFKKLSREGSEQKVNDESIRDTLLDLANYAIMTVMEMDILAEEDEKVKLKGTLNELKNCANDVYISYSCSVCGGRMTFEKELNRHICKKCGARYEVKASNGKPDTDPNPCEKCTYPAKATCGECVDRIAWEKRQRGDTDAAEAEQADE